MSAGLEWRLRLPKPKVGPLLSLVELRSRVRSAIGRLRNTEDCGVPIDNTGFCLARHASEYLLLWYNADLTMSSEAIARRAGVVDDIARSIRDNRHAHINVTGLVLMK